MYRIFYAEKDATIYENHPNRNTGIDQILELIKIASGSKVDGVIKEKQYNTRILLTFGKEITALSESIVAGDIPALNNNNVTSASVFLNLHAADASDLLHDYDVKAYPISQSWINGNGYATSQPEQTNGVSWDFRNYKDGLKWHTGSYSSGTSPGATRTTGGGSWYTGSGYEASQSFSNESPDLRMNVTDIVSFWLKSGSAVNHGFMIKRPKAQETNSDILGSLKFFGRESHTIYVPRLEVCWDNVVNTDGASTTQIASETYVPYIKNIKAEDRRSDIARFRIGVRPEFPTKTYTTASFYMTTDRLPNSSSYTIYDSITNDIILKDEPIWGNSKTKIAYDANGSYFDLRMDSFMPERYYKIQLKCIRTNDTQTFDDFYFKVVN